MGLEITNVPLTTTGVIAMGVLILLFGLQADISNKHRQRTGCGSSSSGCC